MPYVWQYTHDEDVVAMAILDKEAMTTFASCLDAETLSKLYCDYIDLIYSILLL